MYKFITLKHTQTINSSCIILYDDKTQDIFGVCSKTGKQPV